MLAVGATIILSHARPPDPSLEAGTRPKVEPAAEISERWFGPEEDRPGRRAESSREPETSDGGALGAASVGGAPARGRTPRNARRCRRGPAPAQRSLGARPAWAVRRSTCIPPWRGSPAPAPVDASSPRKPLEGGDEPEAGARHGQHDHCAPVGQGPNCAHPRLVQNGVHRLRNQGRGARPRESVVGPSMKRGSRPVLGSNASGAAPRIPGMNAVVRLAQGSHLHLFAHDRWCKVTPRHLGGGRNRHQCQRTSSPRTQHPSLPLDGRGRLARDVVADPVAATHFVDDPGADPREDFVGEAGPVGGHPVP